MTGLARALEDVEHRPLLDDAARPHHRHAVRHLGHHAHVVGDEQEGGGEVALEVAHQPQDLGLHGDVEGGGGFVGDQHLGAARQRHGDHHALAHAAAELVRVLIEPPPGVGDADGVEGVARPGPGVAALAPASPNRLDELRPDGHHRVERRHRLLEHHGDVAAAQGTESALRQAGELAPVETDAAPRDPERGRGQEPHQGQGGQRLARAGLTGEAQRLLAREREGDAVEHALQPRRRPSVDRQSLDGEQRRWGARHDRTMRGK